MRYDRVWRNLVQRAVAQGGLDIDAFVQQGIEAGMSEETIQRRLLDDLENDGPIFGKFFRSLAGAAEGAALSAYDQGADVGNIDGNRELKRLLGLREKTNAFGSVIDVADPDAMAEIAEAVAERDERIWIAELQNTCHLCLPLHGTTRTMAEWTELGYHPDTIHSAEGWASRCKCKLVPVQQADRLDEMQPLVRNKLETADPKRMKTNRQTKRGVTQVDLERSLAARDKALQSEAGRRTMRLLGESRSQVVERDVRVARRESQK